MNLDSQIRLYCQSAGTQSIEPGAYEDERIKRYLRKKQDKLDKLRRLHTPYPEDVNPNHVNAAKVEPGHWSPAPEDVENLNRKGYKVAMRKGGRKKIKVALHTAPGAQPVEDIVGALRIAMKRSMHRHSMHRSTHRVGRKMSQHIHERQHHEALRHLKEMAKGVKPL